MRVVRLYGRPGCCLCEDAMTMLTGLQEELGGFRLEEIDIEADDELFKRYLERIPVVMIDDQVLSELVPNLDRLRRSLDTVST